MSKPRRRGGLNSASADAMSSLPGLMFGVRAPRSTKLGKQNKGDPDFEDASVNKGGRKKKRNKRNSKEELAETTAPLGRPPKASYNKAADNHDNHSPTAASEKIRAAAKKFPKASKKSSSTREDSSHHRSNDASLAPILVDPGALARGMTARRVGACVSSMVHILNPQQIQSDLELMDAYSEACRTYTQKYFAYRNPDLCRVVDEMGNVEYVGTQHGSSATNNNMNAKTETSSSMLSSPSQNTATDYVSPDNSSHRRLYGARQVMPVRIDPEEEKRIAALRQLVATQEKEREELESHFISLQANYVRELQLLDASKYENKVAIGFLQQLCQKRAKVLALRRVRCQIARDVSGCLQWRRMKIEESDNIMQVEKLEGKEGSVEATTLPIDGGWQDDKDVFMDAAEEKKVNDDPKEAIEGLNEMWNFVECELATAEAECNKVEVSKEELSNAILAQFIRDPSMLSDKSAGRDEKDIDKIKEVNNGTGKDKSSDSLGLDKLEKRKYRHRAMSCGSLDETAVDNSKKMPKESEDSSRSGITISAPSLALPLSATDKNVVPWRSLTIPRTPRGVPLYISQLSSYPDKVAGAGYGGFLGNKNEDMRYLLPLDRIHGRDHAAYGLPGSHRSEMIEMNELAALEIEISHLESSIREERLLNDKLQAFAVDRKRKCDDICTAMTLLRSETENVLLRHNMILNSKEARMRSWEVVTEGRKEEVTDEQYQIRVNDDEEMEDQIEASEAGMEESQENDEDDLEESEPETAVGNEIDKDDIGDTDADEEDEDEDEDNPDNTEEEEDMEEDDDEDEVDPSSKRSTRIVLRAKVAASESDEDLEEDTDDADTAEDENISGNDEEINSGVEEEYSEEEEGDVWGQEAGGEDEASERGSTSSGELDDNSNIDDDGEEEEVDEDDGSELDGEDYDSSEEFGEIVNI